MYRFLSIILPKDKAKIRRNAVAFQGFLTQSSAKFAEKMCMNPYVDRFLKTPKAQYGVQRDHIPLAGWCARKGSALPETQ